MNEPMSDINRRLVGYNPDERVRQGDLYKGLARVEKSMVQEMRIVNIYETALHRMLAMSNADPKAYADCARDALDKVAKLKETP